MLKKLVYELREIRFELALIHDRLRGIEFDTEKIAEILTKDKKGDSK